MTRQVLQDHLSLALPSSTQVWQCCSVGSFNGAMMTSACGVLSCHNASLESAAHGRHRHTPSHIQQHLVLTGSVQSLLEGGTRLPTAQLPKKSKVQAKACVRLLFEELLATTGSFLYMISSGLCTITEVALFVYLLPEFSKPSQVNYTLMAIELNNRVLQAFRAGKP